MRTSRSPHCERCVTSGTGETGYESRIPNFKSHSSIVDYWFDSAYMAFYYTHPSSLVWSVWFNQINETNSLSSKITF
jgi:hypothetical protein